MASLDFFGRFGLFVHKEFLDAEFCTRYLAEACLASATQALVLPKNDDRILEPQLCTNHRRTEQINVPVQTELFIQERLLAIKPLLERHFDLPLTGFQKPLFYLYKEGGFFGVHQDSSAQPDAPQFIKERRVSVILFLNNQALEPLPGNYCGGNLAFYGLINDPRWQTYGFPFDSEPGMLLAFHSNIWHDVKPVTYGERHTIVSWFF